VKPFRTAIPVMVLGSLLLGCAPSWNASPGRKGIPSNGLVASYPFDGDAGDNSGNAHNGTVVGATLTTGRNGEQKSAYLFDGVDDYISVADAPLLRISGQITMSAWINAAEGVLPFAGIICKAEPREPRHGYIMCIDDQGNAMAGVYYDHSTGVGSSVSSEENMTDSNWHHIAATYNGIELKLYINGVLYTKKNYRDGLQANAEPLLIGWDQNT
jgi:trimeric autotransporter adhesin